MKSLLLKLPCYLFAFILLIPDASATDHSPRSLKEGAITKLESIGDSSSRKVRKITEKAEREIWKSLSDKEGALFLDEARIHPLFRGNRVFYHESRAARELQRGLRDKRIPGSVKVVFREVLADLVEADRQIAELAIQSAELLVEIGQGNPLELRRAKREYVRALKL